MALNEDFVMPINQWFHDEENRILKIGNGQDALRDLLNIYPVAMGTPAEVDTMYGVQNGQYVKVTTVPGDAEVSA